MSKEKLIQQLFLGKVATLIGFDEATKLLKESKDAIEALPLCVRRSRPEGLRMAIVVWRGTSE